MSNRNADIAIINKVLDFQESGVFESGVIESRWILLSTIPDVIAAIRRFGGMGWIQLAGDTSEIVTFQDVANEIKVDENRWPVLSESCNGLKSLHVRSVGNRWEMLVLEEKPGDGILETQHMLQRGGGKMTYRLFYQEESNSMRLKMVRFSGFDQGGSR